MHRYPHQFSGGQQQRICIGRAIALNPKLIVCDEAVSALDVSVQAQILNLLLELKDTLGLSYLFISHDLSVIRHMSDRIVVMHYGKIVEHGSTEDIFKDPKDHYTKKLLLAIPRDHPARKTAKTQIATFSPLSAAPKPRG
jgi:ABC-type oligopeptide transport system ATPase subunit